MSLLPQLKAQGIFTFDAPFDTIGGIEYQCTGIDTLQSLVQQGKDVFTIYYDPYGLVNAEYVADIAAGESIVTLTPLDGTPQVFVSSRYITGIPTVGTVPYSRIILSADLGPLPDSLSLATAQTMIGDVLSDVVGKAPTVRLHKVMVAGGVNYEESNILEVNRNLLIQQRQTAYAELSRLTTLLAERDARIQLLEDALVSVAI